VSWGELKFIDEFCKGVMLSTIIAQIRISIHVYKCLKALVSLIQECKEFTKIKYCLFPFTIPGKWWNVGVDNKDAMAVIIVHFDELNILSV